MQRLMQPDTPSADGSLPNTTGVRPDRPCDSCRRRKTRCLLKTEDSEICILCAFHNQPCTFLEDAAPRRRKVRTTSNDAASDHPGRIRIGIADQTPRRQSETSVRTLHAADDYANLQGSSLLKKTLGLQNHRYATYIGPTDVHDAALLNLRHYDDIRHESSTGSGSVRRVKPDQYFHQQSDAERSDHTLDIQDVDDVEQMVAPHGYALIKLYFRIVHPTFPILHKKVYLERYARSHREFSPPLLAAVYLLALNWWSYSSEVSKLAKPNTQELEELSLRALWRISRRAKLSTVQAGLLLSQLPNIGCWPLTSMVVGMAQDLGLHLDCTNWRIPSWERGLRKRLAWAVFMQDTWSALSCGRPPHLSMSNWGVQPVVSSDFPESAADEDDEEGSTEVEKGRTLFSAMITLTKMLYEVLGSMYSIRAEAEVSNARSGTETALAQAKPIQLKIRAWYAQMPDALQMTTPQKVGKLDSVGYLHLAYYATEMTIHRKIIRSISVNTDPYLVQVCRTAAKARLVSAMEFFDRLKPEHLHSFWYFASNFNFALIGTFAGLCAVTSGTQEEAEYYQKQLQRYRWTLRVWSHGVSFLEKVSDTLASAVDPLNNFSAAANTTTHQDKSLPFLRSDGDQEENFDEVFAHSTVSQFWDDSTGEDVYFDDARMHSV